MLSLGFKIVSWSLKKVFPKLPRQLKEEPQVLKDRSAKIQRTLADINAEISSTFRMQSKLQEGTEALKLAVEHLEDLAKRRNELNLLLLELKAQEEGLVDAKEVVHGIRERILEFKKGFSKAPPAVQRRLLRKVIGNLSYTPGRLEIEFNLSEARANNVISINRGKIKGKGQILDVSGPPALPPRAAGSDLSLPFVNLRDGLNGWVTLW